MTASDRVTPRNVYLYAVCLITLLISIHAAVHLVRSTVGIIDPQPDYSIGFTAVAGTERTVEEFLSELQKDAVEDEQRRAEVRDAVTAGATLPIAGGLFAYHWRRAQAERSGQPAAPVQEVPAGPPAP